MENINKIVEELNNNIFMDEYSDEFLDYLETEKVKILKENMQYIEISKKIEDIKKDFPNVRNYLENKEIKNLTKTELQEISSILDLQQEIQNIEEITIFKLGMKEVLQFLKQIKIL